MSFSDAGCQFKSIRDSERLAEIGAAPSIGTVGDSFDTLGCGGRLRIRREARTTLCDWRRIHTINPTMSRMAPVVPRMGMPRTQPSAMTAIPKMMKMITVSRIYCYSRAFCVDFTPTVCTRDYGCDYPERPECKPV
jgi:hypothetical protein